MATTTGAKQLEVRSANEASWETLFTFLGPALLIYVAFTLYPVWKTFYNSLYVMTPPHNVQKYVGLGNFVSLLTQDQIFRQAVRNTAIFSVVGTLADVGGGLLLALCLFA